MNSWTTNEELAALRAVKAEDDKEIQSLRDIVAEWKSAHERLGREARHMEERLRTLARLENAVRHPNGREGDTHVWLAEGRRPTDVVEPILRERAERLRTLGETETASYLDGIADVLRPRGGAWEENF